MKYVFVIDSDGYVFKKLEAEVTPDEKIITEKEYMKKIWSRPNYEAMRKFSKKYKAKVIYRVSV